MFKIEYFNKQKHYNELENWWLNHNHSIIPSSSLPIGVVVYSNNIPICMSFLYTMDGCDMAQIGWTTTNPASSLKNKYNGINLAIDSLITVCKKLNKKHITSFCNSSGINKIMKRKGFVNNKSHELYVGSL